MAKVADALGDARNLSLLSAVRYLRRAQLSSSLPSLVETASKSKIIVELSSSTYSTASNSPEACYWS
jgi:hypothetical protein